MYRATKVASRAGDADRTIHNWWVMVKGSKVERDEERLEEERVVTLPPPPSLRSLYLSSFDRQDPHCYTHNRAPEGIEKRQQVAHGEPRPLETARMHGGG